MDHIFEDELFHTSKSFYTPGKESEIFFHSEGEYYNMYATNLDYPSSSIDRPHTHPYHEIFILLDGEIDYMVEGAIFPIKAGDVIIIGAGDPHSKVIKGEKNISILVLEVARKFFVENNCQSYEQIFTSKHSTDHKISTNSARDSGLTGAYKRLLLYGEDSEDFNTPAIKSVLIELLYLSGHAEFSKNYISNPQIQQVVDYININYTKKISLEDIAEKLFLSKSYICRNFKKHTGDTIKGYITKKRLAKIEHLTANGSSISDACLRSGFGDYTSFYKAFLKTNGKPPKQVLKK